MAKTAYVGGRIKEIPLVQEIQGVLRGLGYHIGYDWTTDGSARGNPERMTEIGPKMVKACVEADLVVLLIANGERSPQRGVHVEMGAALAGGAQVILWVPPEDAYLLESSHPRCISFYCHPLVELRLTCPRERLVLELTFKLLEGQVERAYAALEGAPDKNEHQRVSSIKEEISTLKAAQLRLLQETYVKPIRF